MHQLRKALAVVIASMGLAQSSAYAADSYLGGTMTNITSTPAGLMIMLDSGVPTNCTGTGYGWMLIPEANKTMIATALTMWVTGQRGVVVYTNGYNGQSFCVINQFDPN